MNKKNIVHDKTAKLRNLAEEKIKQHKTHLNQAFSLEESHKLVHELRVHQVELEMQNDELRKKQEELEILHERYFDLYDKAPVGYFTLYENGTIMESNIMGANLLGLSRMALIKQPLTNFIFQEDQDIYYLQHKKVLNAEAPQKFELRMMRQKTTSFWARFEMVKTQDKITGEPIYRIIMSDITGRKLAEEKIETLLAEKQLMLKEVHHRIKNNMNTVTSIMTLQIDTLKEPSAIAAINDARARVYSMMLLYDKLYRSDDFKQMPFKQYLSSLVDEIIDNFPNKEKVKIEKSIDDFRVEPKMLYTLGIIINEILTNIMKYAFTGRDNGLIKLTAAILDNRITVTIADNGIGIPESINIATSIGFGFQLVDMMTQALKGTIKIERNNGTKFILEFNL